mgnify:CR=1 FL=1
MASYLPPKENLSVFNPTVFKSSLTDEEIESKITSLDRVIKTNDDELNFPFGFETTNGGTNTGAGKQIGFFSLSSSGEGIYPHYIKTRHSNNANNAIDFYLNKNGSDSFIAAITRNGVGIGVQEPICDLNVVKTVTTEAQNTLAEFRLGDYGNDSSQAALVNIRSSGENSDAVIQFGTPHSVYESSEPTEGFKGAIVFEGINNNSRQKFHVCLDDTENNNNGNNAYDIGITKSKMSVDYDGNMIVAGSITSNSQSFMLSGLKVTRGIESYGADTDTSIDNRLITKFPATNGFNVFDKNIDLDRDNYRNYFLGLLGDDGANANNIFAIAVNAGGTQPRIGFGMGSNGDTEVGGSLTCNRSYNAGSDDILFNAVKTDLSHAENILAEFRLGDYSSIGDKAAIVNIRSAGQSNDAVIQFASPGTVGNSRFTSSNPTEGFKGAIVFEGMNSSSRQKFHVCLDDTDSNNQTGLNAYYQGDLSKSKMSVDYDGNMVVVGTVTANGIPLTSDDRIKENEQLIENATETLSKLTPQIYDKYNNMELTGDSKKESGLITQEVYYNAPELRHLVNIQKEYDASGNDITPVPDEMDLSNVDIQNDPDYSAHGWGEKITSLDYNGLIPYLIKSNQEMNAIIKEMKNEIELLKKVDIVEPVVEPVVEVVETP